MKRSLSILLLLPIFFCALSSCAEEEPNSSDGIIYQSENVTVTELSEPDKISYADYYFIDYAKKEVFEISPIIFVGMIERVTPVSISYRYDGTENISHDSILDIKISKILRNTTNTDLNSSQNVRVYIPYNMETYDVRLPILEEGASLLLFCDFPMAANDPLELSAFVDYRVICTDKLVAEKVGDYYIISDLFAEELSLQKNIAQLFDLSEDQILEMRDIPIEFFTLDHPKVASACSKYHDPEFAWEVISVLKRRSSYALYNSMTSNYLIPASQYENFIESFGKEY